jgi:hypothetical protein
VTSHVYILHADSNKDLALGTELNYFQTHFIAQPMAAEWKPPPVRVIGKSKRLRDFVSWMNAAPVISPAACDALRTLLAPHSEVLPLIELRGKLYSALNVLTTVDCLDHGASDILYSSNDPDHILSISTYQLHLNRIPDATPIFKLPEYTGCVFATDVLVDAVRNSQLRGAAFLDPAVNPFSKIMRGEPLNVVAGLAE